MENTTNGYTLWLQAGYKIFSAEGCAGLKVERISRILSRNKSAYYHYFGDAATYLEHVISFHRKRMNIFISGVESTGRLEQFIDSMDNHADVFAFHLKLGHHRNVPVIRQNFDDINRRISDKILPVWSAFIGLEDSPTIASDTFAIFIDRLSMRWMVDENNRVMIQNEALAIKRLVQKLAPNRFQQLSKSA